jgi:hypothetical protein
MTRYYFFERKTGGYGADRLLAEYSASSLVTASKYFAKSFPFVFASRSRWYAAGD